MRRCCVTEKVKTSHEQVTEHGLAGGSCIKRHRHRHTLGAGSRISDRHRRFSLRGFSLRACARHFGRGDQCHDRRHTHLSYGPHGFLTARTALGDPLLRRAGPRAHRLARGFREDAFSYLLFLRLVPAFPFFLVNLVPAFAGVRLGPFIAATAIGIIPGAIVFALAGVGLDSMIAAQKNSGDQCIAAGGPIVGWHSTRRMF